MDEKEARRKRFLEAAGPREKAPHVVVPHLVQVYELVTALDRRNVRLVGLSDGSIDHKVGPRFMALRCRVIRTEAAVQVAEEDEWRYYLRRLLTKSYSWVPPEEGEEPIEVCELHLSEESLLVVGSFADLNRLFFGVDVEEEERVL